MQKKGIGVGLASVIWGLNLAGSAMALELPPPQQLEAIEITGEKTPPAGDTGVTQPPRTAVRADLEPDSPVNLYPVEASARFGSETFTAADIENLKPSDVFDLVDKAAGISLIYQGRRSPFMVEERGGGSFTYIIDGALLPPSFNRILYKFPTAAIEQMQIVRGSTSLTLGPSIPIGASSSGSGLNTGFVIIRTKQPQKTQAILTGAVEKAKGGHPAAYNWTIQAGTEADTPSGANMYLGGLVNKMDRPSQESWFDGRASEGGMLNTGGKFGKVAVNLMAYHDNGSFEMQRGVTVTGATDSSKWYYDPLKTTIYSGDAAAEWGHGQTTLLNLFKTTYDQLEHVESFANTSATIRQYSETTSGFGLRHHARYKDTLLRLGWQMSDSSGFGPNLSTDYNRYNTRVSGWSTSLEQRFFSGKVICDAGYREDTKRIDNSSSGKSAAAAHDNADTNVHMAPARALALGAHWQPVEPVEFDGRYYHGNQGTSGDFDLRAKSGDLHPEKQERYELAVASNHYPFLRPVLTWFSVKGENIKTAGTDTYTLPSGTYYYYTESDANRQGLELAAKGDFTTGTSYTISWTHMLKNETSSGGVTSDALGVSEPKNLYAFTLGQRWRDYQANLSLKKVDEWYDSNSPMGLAHTDGLGGYTRLDANVRGEFKAWERSLTVTLYGRNLGDKHYVTRYTTGYYPDRGRTLGTEISLSF